MTLTTEQAQPAATPAPGGTSTPSTPSAPATASPVAISTPATPSEAPKQLTLDEQLEAVWAKSQAPKAAPVPAQPIKAATPEPAPDEAAEDEATEPVSDQPAIKGTEPDQSPAIAAPNSWSAEAKAKWTSLPPETQKYIAERESQAHQRITQQGVELRQYQPIREVYDYVRSRGVPQGREAEVIASWARAQEFLDRDPVAGIQWLANSFGLDLAKLAGQPQQANQSDAIDDLFRDPRVDRITPEVGELRNQVTQLQRALAARENAESSQREREIVTLIQKFSADKPYWNDVAKDVMHEVQILKQSEPGLTYEELLQKAYDRAQWASPDIRTRILEDQRKAELATQETERKRQAEEAAKKATQAKKVASMNVRTGAAATTPTYDGKWDNTDALSAIYDRINSGG